MSAQQDRYLEERARGESVSNACYWSGISPAEAALIEKDIARGALTLPPPRNHNKPEEPPMSESIVAADELRSLIERVERLEEEKKAIADDIKDIYGEAKSRGYDTRTIREIVKLRKLETHVRQEREALLETYRAALGMDYASTPLGNAAMNQALHDLENSDTPLSLSTGGETIYKNKALRAKEATH